MDRWPTADGPWAGNSTGIRLRPTRDGAVPLLLELMEHQGVPEGFLVLRAAPGDLEISRHPDCGCDAGGT